MPSVCSRLWGERAAFCVMSNPSNSKSAPQSEPQTFALDHHTRQFFDPGDWEAPVEASFYLDMPGLRGREFHGRLALFCDGEPVIAITEIGGDGGTLLKRPPYPPKPDEMEPEQREGHWAQWLGLARTPRPSGCPLPILPNLSSNTGLSRLHFDVRSGFGAQICSSGHGHLFDLRDVESAEKRHRPHVDMRGFVDGDANGQPALGEMSAQGFHGALDGMFRDNGCALFQVLRFYALSDDERALEVFGCNHRSLRRALEGLRLSLQIALGPGGEFAGCPRAIWHPWHGDGAQTLGVHRGGGWWADIAPPEKLAALVERVLTATGCRLRLEWRAGDFKEDAVVDARLVGLEWANELSVRSEGVSAHEAMEAATGLRELLG